MTFALYLIVSFAVLVISAKTGAGVPDDTALIIIAILSAGEAKPVRHGKWIEYPIADGMNQCSECGVLRFGDSNYCPNCGAKMDAE